MPMAYNQDPRYAQTPEAQQLAQQTLRGDFLKEENPYLKGVIDAANRDVTNATQQQMGQLSAASLRPGQFGSTVWANQRNQLQDDMAKRISDATFGTRAGAYEAERGRQNEVLGMGNQRDAAIWGDLSQREAAAQQANAASRGARAQAAAAAQQAKVQEAQIRANLLMQQGQLAEGARQFDATMPLNWAGILGNQINAYGAQDAQDFSGLVGAAGTQMGAQQNAAALGTDLGTNAANLDIQGIAQQLQAAGMLPGYDQASLAPMGMAGDYLANLFGTQGGIDAARMNANASRYATNLGRDQLQYQSVADQWRYNDPQAALNDYLGGLGAVGGLAGGQQVGWGVGAPSAGQVTTRQDNTGQYLQLALGIAAAAGY